MDEQTTTHLNNVKKTAKNYALRRTLTIGAGNSRFKVGRRELEQELEVASVHGELSCLERILTMLQQNPTMDRTELEAEVHLAIVDYNEFVGQYTGYGLKVNLDGYLGLRGYYKKEGEQQNG